MKTLEALRKAIVQELAAGEKLRGTLLNIIDHAIEEVGKSEQTGRPRYRPATEQDPDTINMPDPQEPEDTQQGRGIGTTLNYGTWDASS